MLRVRRYIGFYCLPRTLHARLRWYLDFRTALNLKNPRTLNEKLQWKKLYGFSPTHTLVADKYIVREYVNARIGKKYLVPLIAVLDDASKIRLQELPESFVMKANHGSGQNRIVRNKYDVVEKELRDTARKWLRENTYICSREPQYKDIPRKIIIEKLLLDKDGKIPMDYKFHCFHGKAEMIQVDIDRFGDHRRSFFNTNWELLPFTWCRWGKSGPTLLSGGVVERPRRLQDMINIAQRLAREFDYIRVDLYQPDEIYFGELTLHHGGGRERFAPPYYDKYYGTKLNLRK